MTKKLSSLLLILLCLIMCGCNKNIVNGDKNDMVKKYLKDTNPVVTITMENGKTMEIELFPYLAPNTVNNFIDLVQNGKYDGSY